MSVCVPDEEMKYHFNNAMGDECIFVHFGKGTLYTQFGTIPSGNATTSSFPKARFTAWSSTTLLKAKNALESWSLKPQTDLHIGPPPRYISKQTSQFLEHAPYCERDLRGPEFPLTFDESGEFEVHQSPTPRPQIHLRPPPVGCCGLGWVLLPVRLQYR